MPHACHSEPFASLRVNAARNLSGSRTTPRFARGDHAGCSQVIGITGEFRRSDGTTEGTVQVLPEPAFARAMICGQAFITSQTDLYVLLLNPNRCTISGRVTDGAGRGVAGATMQAGAQSATTDADGFYSLSGLPMGTYTLTAALSGYQITPVSRTVTVSSDVSGQDFSAAPLTYRISGRVTDGGARRGGRDGAGRCAERRDGC
ncbi:carboxypeptidase-like regulatory domain-containing protein [Roseiflexus castenholzii]|uniref:carboxypeptidase-like regulatory domain-containing protein n=1 Tax=Roseiflexus castenholzii TaxID=120962 RepID=UPI003C7A4FAB